MKDINMKDKLVGELVEVTKSNMPKADMVFASLLGEQRRKEAKVILDAMRAAQIDLTITDDRVTINVIAAHLP